MNKCDQDLNDGGIANTWHYHILKLMLLSSIKWKHQYKEKILTFKVHLEIDENTGEKFEWRIRLY